MQPNLRPVRFGSSADKIWFFRPEDMAAFPTVPNGESRNITKILFLLLGAYVMMPCLTTGANCRKLSVDCRNFYFATCQPYKAFGIIDDFC